MCSKQLRINKKKKRRLIIYQILLFLILILLWEGLTYFNILDSFLFSSPSKVIKMLIKYIESGELLSHIGISVLEVILGIVIGTILGLFVAFILWYFENLSKILEPFLSMLNALPKTAIAPILIIWAGTNVKGIVVVALSILTIITIISALNYFNSVDEEKIKMLKSFKANKIQIFRLLILPTNIPNIINIIKINVGMSWIGVIVGEFLVSRKGIGYLIMYGGAVFDLDLVMMGVMILSIIALVMWKTIDIIENYYKKKNI